MGSSVSSKFNVAGAVLGSIDILAYVLVLTSLWDNLSVNNRRLSVLGARTALFFPIYTSIMLISLLAPAGITAYIHFN